MHEDYIAMRYVMLIFRHGAQFFPLGIIAKSFPMSIPLPAYFQNLSYTLG